MSHPPQAPPPTHALLSLRSPSSHFLLVLQSIAHSVAYSRLGAGKARLKIVEQASDDPVLAFGTFNIMREMDLRHPAALMLLEVIESHHQAFGMGCTTLLAWIGLLAASVTRLTRETRVHPVILVDTLADIQRMCADELESDQTTASEHRSCVIPLPSVVDEYRKSLPPATDLSAIVMPPPPPITRVEGDEEMDWFFDGDTAAVDATDSLASPLIGSAPSESLLGFLTFLGERLSHGQAEPMRAAAAVVHRMLHTQGIVSVSDLLLTLSHSAGDGAPDLTIHWDLTATLTVQSTLGSTAAFDSSNTARGSCSTVESGSSASLFSSRWDLVEGVLLDLFSSDVAPARQTIAHRPLNTPVGVVIVNGDISMVEMSHVLHVRPGAADAASMQRLLQKNERRREVTLVSLQLHLQSLGVGLVISKGSCNKEIMQHLRAHGILCLETVNLPRLEAVSRLTSAPFVCELSTVTRVHIGHARLAVREVGWNPELVHQNVVRELDKNHGATPDPEAKLVLSQAEIEASDLPPAMTLFTAHATAVHSRIFVAAFWNCLHRLRHALRDRSVCRGDGFVESCWIRLLDRRAASSHRFIAARLAEPTIVAPAAVSAEVDNHGQVAAVCTAVADAFRHFRHRLEVNAADHSPDAAWVRAYGISDDGTDDSPSQPLPPPSSATVRYDNVGCKCASLTSVMHLFQLFLRLDSALLCAHGRTIYQRLDGQADAQGHSVRII